MLLQGIQLPQTLPEAQEPLQAAKRPRTEPEQPAEQHQYKLPESTAGQAKQRQTSTGRPPLRPKAPAQSPMLVTSSAPGTSVQMVPVAKLTTFKLQLVEAAKYGPDSGQRIRRSLQIEMFIYFQYVSTYASGMK